MARDRLTRIALVAALADAAVLVVAAVVGATARTHSSGLPVLLLAAAALAGASVLARPGRTSISGSFVVVVLAAALSGSLVACGTVVISECVAVLRLRSRPRLVATNLLAGVLPALLVSTAIRHLAPGARDSVAFYVVSAAAGMVLMSLNFALISASMWIETGATPLTPRLFLSYLPSQTITVALALVGAGFYYKVGLAGIGLVLVAVFAFNYMAGLLEQSRERAQQYVALSWGVLGGLMRSLHTRDAHAARHAAAVAGFAQDIARAAGLDERACELAHTAGLLHDIGRFALSDRVAERGRELTDEDWAAIQRHPELGADLLKDLGMYGPVAEIVLAHHERVDGLGYPRGLPGEEIPELSKIVAVAEVYDTLTAQDTYRTPMSSFEALRELRRVAGSQLDAGYVELFATLLGREGFAYRHRDAADFDTELGIERRIGEAAAGG